MIDANQIPTLRGHSLSEDDQRRREQILTLMTTFRVRFADAAEAATARRIPDRDDQGRFCGIES